MFFRDDDLGWEHAKFRRLLDLFVEMDFKLNAEAIPLEAARVCRADEFADCRRHLEVHAHGYRHANHQAFGKKAEFGPGRDPTIVRRELAEAGCRTTDLFGGLYFPAFTPPWNRIHEAFVPLVREAGFKVLSRDGPERASAGLLELNIALDLHTDRKHPGRTVDEWVRIVEQRPAAAFGIMLHHGCMEEADFRRLRELLVALKERGVCARFFSELQSSAEEQHRDIARAGLPVGGFGGTP